MIKGIIPPQAIDLEEAVIGSLLIDKKGFDDVKDILNPNHFYKTSHQLIIESIKQLSLKNEPIDLLTVVNQLKLNGDLDEAGGQIYLIQLTQKISSSAHIQTHYKIIQQKYLQRQLISLSNEVIEKSYDDTTDVLETIETVKKQFEDIEKENETESMPSLEEQINSIDFNTKIKGLVSGIEKINKDYNGWHKSDLIIIAGRPGMGKSSVIIPDIIQQLINNETVVFFLLEMRYTDIIYRLASFLTGIEFSKMRTNNLSQGEKQFINVALIWLKQKKLFIFDKPHTVENIINKSEKIKQKHGLASVYIDHIGLVIKPKGNNTNQQIEHISNSLKRGAKSLDVPLFCLSQLSRNVNNRGNNKRPTLSDLRDSGAVEQDADIVVFCYRPEHKEINIEEFEDGEPTHNKIELMFSKVRNGECQNIRLNCYIGTQRIGEKTYSEYEQFGQKILKYKTEIKEPKFIIPTATPSDAFDDLPY